MKKLHFQLWLYALLSIFAISCRSQTVNEQISSTVNEVLKAIKDSNSVAFISLIGHSDLSEISKNEEMVNFDVKKIHNYLLANYADSPVPFVITETYNFLGQKKVKVVLDKRNPSQIISLNLLFGPDFIAPLSKLSGYKLVTNNEDSADFKPLTYWKQNGNAQ